MFPDWPDLGISGPCKFVNQAGLVTAGLPVPDKEEAQQMIW